MESEARALWEAATKHMPTQKDMRTIWSILAILSSVLLALSLGTTVAEVLANSPHALDWAAWTGTFSVWLVAALYARRPEYYQATMRRRIQWYRKSRSERIRAVCDFAGIAAGLLALVFGGPILLGILWPGQPWAPYLLQTTPILPLGTAVMMLVAIMIGSLRGRASKADKSVG